MLLFKTSCRDDKSLRDIKLYYSALNTSLMYQKANKAKIADYTGPISLSITRVMPITTNIHQARTIPDSHLRKVAHDAELDQLDDIKAIIYVDITPRHICIKRSRWPRLTDTSAIKTVTSLNAKTESAYVVTLWPLTSIIIQMKSPPSWQKNFCSNGPSNT